MLYTTGLLSYLGPGETESVGGLTTGGEAMLSAVPPDLYRLHL